MSFLRTCRLFEITMVTVRMLNTAPGIKRLYVCQLPWRSLLENRRGNWAQLGRCFWHHLNLSLSLILEVAWQPSGNMLDFNLCTWGLNLDASCGISGPLWSHLPARKTIGQLCPSTVIQHSQERWPTETHDSIPCLLTVVAIIRCLVF